MKKLLLISTSQTHGTEYLDHCAEEVAEHFDGAGRVLFVPHALFNHDGYADKVRERFARFGLGLDPLHLALDPVEAVEEARGVFIGGGNTFRLLKSLYDMGVVEPLRKRIEEGIPYMGTSAGSNVACVTIKTTNDMPILHPPTLDALGLVPFNINPHYFDPDPGSAHMGETRVTRIREFHEENDVPVVGLREGSMLRVRGSEVELLGAPGAKLFLKGEEPQEVESGVRMDSLLEV